MRSIITAALVLPLGMVLGSLLARPSPVECEPDPPVDLQPLPRAEAPKPKPKPGAGSMVAQAFEHGRTVERLEAERVELEGEHAHMAGVVVFVRCYAESRGVELGEEVSEQMARALERGGDKHTRKCQRLVAGMTDAEKVAKSDTYVKAVK